MSALYRKYRPKTLEDLVGQDHIVKIILSAAKQDRIAHAYLLYGPRGTGKTTTARIIAKIVNCETRSTDKKFHDKGEPCNTCKPCLEIDKGQGLDVVEIDAASNRGIDEIRSLRETIRLSPTSYKYKIFIIDETHQLTKEAFNALLKTLEEPPLHAIFILATTEYEKVPATIASRTQRFHLRKLTLAEIITKLERIVKLEKLNVQKDALEVIAAGAEGSLRDAEALLDQLTALEDEVTVDSVEQIIGKVGFQKTAEFAGIILKGELDNALAYIAKINEEGYNALDLTKELISYLRRALTLKCDPKSLASFKKELTEQEIKRLSEHAEHIKTTQHIKLIQSLIKAYSDMRYSPFQTIPLEVTLIEHLGEGA